MKHIVYNQDTAERWSADTKIDSRWMHFTCCSLGHFFQYRGYMYLSEIYRSFNVEWNPYYEDTLYKYDESNPKPLCSIVSVTSNECTIAINY